LSFVIAGDKFDALASCPKLCSEHTPWFEVKYGDVRRTAGGLQLSVRGQEVIRRTDGHEYNWFPNQLVPVQWGTRQYLVPTERRIAFCNAVNQGEEPRSDDFGEFALGEGQHEIAVTGGPEVPPGWAQYLLKEPVEGMVTELLPGSLARVSAGHKDGLRAGMELLPTDEKLPAQMEIVSVKERECVIKTKRTLGMDRDIRAGDVLSTARPRRWLKLENAQSAEGR
jgi:hypothetical protein